MSKIRILSYLSFKIWTRKLIKNTRSTYLFDFTYNRRKTLTTVHTVVISSNVPSFCTTDLTFNW